MNRNKTHEWTVKINDSFMHDIRVYKNSSKFSTSITFKEDIRCDKCGIKAESTIGYENGNILMKQIKIRRNYCRIVVYIGRSFRERELWLLRCYWIRDTCFIGISTIGF